MSNTVILVKYFCIHQQSSLTFYAFLKKFIWFLYYLLGQPGSPENNESKKSRDNTGLDLSFKREDDDHESEENDDATHGEIDAERICKKV